MSDLNCSNCRERAEVGARPLHCTREGQTGRVSPTDFCRHHIPDTYPTREMVEIDLMRARVAREYIPPHLLRVARLAVDQVLSDPQQVGSIYTMEDLRAARYALGAVEDFL